MKKMIAIAVVLGFSNMALAAPCDQTSRTIKGASAKALISALKMAGLNTTSPIDPDAEAPYTISYETKQLSCEATSGGVFQDGLETYACDSAPAAALKSEANAKLIFDALEEMGVFSDLGMSHTFHDVDQVKCSIEVKSGRPFNYKCTMSAIWADTCQP